jgi:hypothetical protein
MNVRSSYIHTQYSPLRRTPTSCFLLLNTCFCYPYKYGFHNTVTCISDNSKGFGLNRYFDHSQVVSTRTNNYNSITGLHTLKITVAQNNVLYICFHSSLLRNSSQQWLFLYGVFTIRFLAMDINTGSKTVTLQISLYCSTMSTSCLAISCGCQFRRLGPVLSRLLFSTHTASELPIPILYSP